MFRQHLPFPSIIYRNIATVIKIVHILKVRYMLFFMITVYHFLTMTLNDSWSSINLLTIPTFPLDRLSHRPCPWGRRECNNSILSLRGGRRREAPTFKISDTACKKINYHIIESLIFKIIQCMYM